MKYMVLVNRKYMVAVEKDGSNAAAEHEILDNFDGIQGAQAFNREEMKSNYFADVFQTAETISLNELRAKSDRYNEAFKEWARKQDEVDAIRDEIGRLQDEIDRLLKEKNKAGFAERKAHLETIEAKKALNWTEN